MSATQEVVPSDHRARLRVWLETPRVRNTIMGVILINAISLGLSTSASITLRIGEVLSIIDTVVITIFVLEMILKLYAFGWRFFRSAWNVFDLSIVVISLVPSGGNLSVLRAMRVIRAMRLLSGIPQMRAVIMALLDAMPGMGAVIVLLGIVYYIFAVMATQLFSADFPQWFGTVGESLYTLFQIMTLESWSMGIVRPVMEKYPQAWLLFVPFITTTAFAVLNLFIGLLVNTMQAAVEAEGEKEMARMEQAMVDRNDELIRQIAELRALIETQIEKQGERKDDR
ncbi:MAG: ion transporter [Alphaproteobacteria bacterium]|nr:MAG: ion transporter [Alphaproteobacteria bacterium]